MNIIYDICDDFLLDTQLIDILTKYDDLNIKMLNFIKTKDKLYFQLLDKYILNELTKGITKIIIKQSLINKITNLQLLDLIIDQYQIQQKQIQQKQIPLINHSIDKFKIILDQSELYPPIKPLILNQSQNQVLNYYQINGVKSGLITHATGTGKTNCIFLTMGYNQPDVIFILCSYKSILKQLLYTINNDDKYVLDYEKFRQLKYGNYLNLWDYSIYNLADDKSDRKNLIKNLLIINKTLCKKIFLINPQFISIKERYKLLPRPDLIIHDECHSITGNYTNIFLKYFINHNTAIIGLSATPIRHIQKSSNRNLIDTIFTTNIISTYENITAIINKDILNLEFYWFDANLNENSITNRKNRTNIDNMINTIIRVYDRLPNKKILIWCGTTQHADHIYDIITTTTKISSRFNNIYIDHSKINDLETTSYKQFKISTNRSILVVAEKYREGSDIEYLDCIIFADMVKTKTDIPFIQSIGRVQRLGYSKTVGFVIDHYEIKKEQVKAKFIIDKLIRYYYEFFLYGNEQNQQQNTKQALKLYEDILKNITFETINDENVIRIHIMNDMYFIIHLNVSSMELNDIELRFESNIKQHIISETNLTEREILQFEYDTFKICNQVYMIKTNKEYYSRITEFNYVAEPEIKYTNIWINWYDYLGIDITIYPSDFQQLQQKIKQYKIKTLKQYYKNCESLNLPLMPEELYKCNNIASIFNYNVLVL